MLILWDVDTDIIIMSFEVLCVRQSFLPLGSAVLTILLRDEGHSVSLTAERTNLFTTNLDGSSRFFLFFICIISLDLYIITAVFILFRTVRICMKLHTAHLASVLEQSLFLPYNVNSIFIMYFISNDIFYPSYSKYDFWHSAVKQLKYKS